MSFQGGTGSRNSGMHCCSKRKDSKTSKPVEPHRHGRACQTYGSWNGRNAVSSRSTARIRTAMLCADEPGAKSPRGSPTRHGTKSRPLGFSYTAPCPRTPARGAGTWGFRQPKMSGKPQGYIIGLGCRHSRKPQPAGFCVMLAIALDTLQNDFKIIPLSF